MPYKKRKYKRKPKRRRKSRLYSMSSPAGVPTKKVVSMRYCSNGTIASTSGILQVHVFSANNLYDPDVTGTGHQPMGHDTMATLYNHYVVLGSKITVQWGQVNTSGGTGNLMVGCYLDDDSTVPYTGYSGLIESRKGTSKLITLQRNAISTTSKFSAKKFFNVNDVKDNFTRLGGDFGNPPGDAANFILWVQSQDISTTNTAYFTVIIDYIVACSEPRSLAPS